MKQVLAILALLFFMTISCKKNKDDNGEPPAPPDPSSPSGVYAVSESLQKGLRLWKNDDDMFTINQSFSPRGMDVYGDKIFISGSFFPGNNNSTGCYWSSETRFRYSVNPTTSDAIVFDIQNVPLDQTGTQARLYMCGYETEFGTRMAKFWWQVSGDIEDEIELSGGVNDAELFAMTATATSLYFAGYERNDNSVRVAKYWKVNINNHTSEEVVLSDGTTPAAASDILIRGSDVLVCGTLNGEPVLWTNGVVTPLDPNKKSSLPVMAINSSNEVCIAYTVISGDHQFAILWKNGQFVQTSMKAYATSIAVKGNDVYVGGGHGVPAVPCYWKNGQQVILDEEDEGVVVAIVVK